MFIQTLPCYWKLLQTQGGSVLTLRRTSRYIRRLSQLSKELIMVLRLKQTNNKKPPTLQQHPQKLPPKKQKIQTPQHAGSGRMDVLNGRELEALCRLWIYRKSSSPFRAVEEAACSAGSYLSLKIFQTRLDKAVSNMVWVHSWSCLKWKVGLETSSVCSQHDFSWNSMYN